MVITHRQRQVQTSLLNLAFDAKEVPLAVCGYVSARRSDPAVYGQRRRTPGGMLSLLGLAKQWHHEHKNHFPANVSLKLMFLHRQLRVQQTSTFQQRSLSPKKFPKYLVVVMVAPQ